jgi:arginase
VLAVISAPSNLGLRPPQPGAVPGTAKAPEALREAGLYTRLAAEGAADAGVVLPGRYLAGPQTGPQTGPQAAGPPSQGRGQVRNQDAILEHAARLAARIRAQLDADRAPLVLGGDCSLLLAAGLALRPRGRYGLVHLDGHTDFRHPGNSADCASLAGEDLAAAVGLHWPAISAAGGAAPHFRPEDTVHAGCRDDDEGLAEAGAVLAQVIPSWRIRQDGAAAIAEAVLATVAASPLDGYWLHLDVDILDPACMPAVDSPAPGGLAPAELTALLAALAPRASGAQVTVFDPDLDPGGQHAGLLASILATGFRQLGTAGRP